MLYGSASCTKYVFGLGKFLTISAVRFNRCISRGSKLRRAHSERIQPNGFRCTHITVTFQISKQRFIQ